MLAPKLKLSNLTAIIDYNKWQATGRSRNNGIRAFNRKMESLWMVCSRDKWTQFFEIHDSFLNTKKVQDKPSIIIANTIKGKEVSFMEDDNNWHYRTPNDEELKLALAELSI